MSPAILGVMIPIIALMIPIVAIWSKHQQKMAELGAMPTQAADPRLATQAEQIRALEDRVRVLERIVTDGNYGIAAEIEALRDKPAASGTPLGLDKERV